jgi:hypothetical protein
MSSTKHSSICSGGKNSNPKNSDNHFLISHMSSPYTLCLIQDKNFYFLAQMKYNLVVQMKYCIFQKMAQMQYAPPVFDNLSDSLKCAGDKHTDATSSGIGHL